MIQPIKDTFYDALKENPTRENFRKMMQKNVGEMDNLDFKEKWIEGAHLAKTLLAMGNSNGGMICVGAKEDKDGTIIPVGIEKLYDKADINNSVSKFIPAGLDYVIYDFSFDNSEYEALKSRRFQLLVVHNTPDRLPFVCVKSSEKEIEKDAIYVRRGTKCEKATADDIERIIEKRISTIYKATADDMTLNKHLDQLKILYRELPKKIDVLIKKGEPTGLELISSLFAGVYKNNDVYEERDNPEYPKESYEAFINRMIDRKKLRIEHELGIK